MKMNIRHNMIKQTWGFFILMWLYNGLSSHPEVFCKKGVLRNFANFTEKHLFQSFFFNKIASVRPATLLNKKPWKLLVAASVFSTYAKFSKNFAQELNRWSQIFLQNVD